MKNLSLILAITAGTLALSACMYPQRQTTLPPGHYENDTESTDAKGTTREQSTSTDVYYDKYGNKQADTKTTITNDPKGLFNKTTTQSKQTTR